MDDDLQGGCELTADDFMTISLFELNQEETGLPFYLTETTTLMPLAWN